MRKMSFATLALVAAALLARQGIARADPATSPWSSPAAIAVQLVHAARPSLAYTSDGTAHAMWESGGLVFYASRSPGGTWTVPARVATGTAPMMVADSAGNLHAVLANEFMGNYDIFYVRRRNSIWSLPVNVSRTSGYSGQPVIAVAADQSLHAAWADTTPGYSTVYYGKWDGRFWISQPVPNARGQAPALASSPDGSLYLVWQDRASGVGGTSGRYDVFLSEYAGGRWSLPINASDSPDSESLGAHVSTTSDGFAHLVWVEQDRQVTYCYGRGTHWSEPQPVQVVSGVARGPSIITAGNNFLHIAWDEGVTIRATSAPASPPHWPSPSTVASAMANLKDVTLALTSQGRVAVGWVQAWNSGAIDLYESSQVDAAPTAPRIWLPLLRKR
jgi:hypothetical protein